MCIFGYYVLPHADCFFLMIFIINNDILYLFPRSSMKKDLNIHFEMLRWKGKKRAMRRLGDPDKRTKEQRDTVKGNGEEKDNVKGIERGKEQRRK